jgi:ubiquinone/menaquinone biosynthesis C-methylase UbiE
MTYDRRFNHTLDVPFFRAQVQKNGGDCLELCCRTGRLLLELAAGDFDAYSVDFAPAMLNEAHEKAAARGSNGLDIDGCCQLDCPSVWIC